MQFFQDEHFSWKVLAVEAVVIMLSVVLGFTLNGWREAQGEQATVEAALQGIAEEVQHNQREIRPLTPYYRTMRDTLARLSAERGDEKTPVGIMEVAKQIPGFGGLKIPMLRASAFETARSTGAISLMDFELADALYAAYQRQQYYESLIEDLQTELIAGDLETLEDWRRAFTVLANNGVDLYPDLLKRLSEEHGITEAQADSTRATS